MGIGYGFHCNKCDYHKNIMQGIGMLYMPEGLIDKLNGKRSLFEDLVRSHKIRQHTYSLLNDLNGRFADGYGHELYVCEHCYEIYDQFYYLIEYTGGHYEPEYKCKCKYPLKRLKINDNPGGQGISDLQGNPVTLKCPKCAEGRLDIKDYILWD
jgi:hypothetical protein